MTDMQNPVTNLLSKYSFWLSILIHVLLLLLILFLVKPQLTKEQEQQQLPHYYVPAYTYTGSIKPSAPRQQQKNIQPKENQENDTPQNNTHLANKKDKMETAENIQSVKQTHSTLFVPKIMKKMPAQKNKNNLFQKSVLAASFNMLREEQMREISQKREEEPIYLIGDDSMPADPLIRLLGRSLSAHFRYPRTAGQLGIRGRVIIGLTLHPEGYYSNVEMMKSSDNQDLDAAALYAVNSAPNVEGADRFISKPKHFVVGFVFN